MSAHPSSEDTLFLDRLAAKDRAEIERAFKITRHFHRNLILYPLLAIGLPSVFALAKNEATRSFLFSPNTRPIVILLAIALAAAASACVTTRAAAAVQRVNIIVNRDHPEERKKLRTQIVKRIRNSGLMTGAANGCAIHSTFLAAVDVYRHYTASNPVMLATDAGTLLVGFIAIGFCNYVIRTNIRWWRSRIDNLMPPINANPSYPRDVTPVTPRLEKPGPLGPS